ncbi:MULTISPECIES: ATP-dependent helicase [Vibrio]|uniref:ATP-dependent helicase n=1 Tax=Vibrio TaxID=662 RepID=UPI0004DF21D5|nr:ATP-dependent helicase [Vibrio parahaemolyticus]HDY7428857.1 ATP-dependent helicase [Vibrio vulnificus]HDY7488524.1 ATP-dependent helicase [Vibrio vulnificus]HDY7951487.1 ATP-dependent helicase [Vibrio vulnificus]HDY8192131.1 ATP-dependent helicase [Vibrio vulnificus]
MNDLLQGLTERQSMAVQSDGVCNVIDAGAGAGKTAVLTRKVYRIVTALPVSDSKYPPVVAITFTRDAANEMGSRIGAMVGAEKAKCVLATTFHSFALNRVIKAFIGHDFFKKHGLRSQVCLASERDILHCIALSIEKGLSQAQQKHLKRIENKPSFSEWLSLTRAFGHSPESYFESCRQSLRLESIVKLRQTKAVVSSKEDAQSILTERDIVNIYYLKAWFEYVDQLRGIGDKGMIDFDEVLVLATQFLELNQDIRKIVKSRYRFICVDEFQDTNNCQFRFVLAISDDGSRLSLFGDIKQAIYGFRGSNPYLFAKIPQIYKNSRVIYLPDNFRSVQQIVEVGNALADNMKLRMSSEPMIAQNNSQPIEPVTIIKLDSEQSEAEWIATKMQWLKDQGIAYKDMKVLYRFRKLANALENELISRNIPCRRVGGNEDKSLYEDPRIIDIVLYLHLIFHPQSKFAMSRFLTEHSQFGFSSQSWRELQHHHTFHNHHHALEFLIHEHFSRNHVGYRPLSELAKDALTFSAKLERLKTFESYCRFRNVQYEGLDMKARAKVVTAQGDAYISALESFSKELLDRYLEYFYLPFIADEYRQRMVKRDIERFQEDFRAVCSGMFSHTRLFDEKLNVLEYMCSRPLLSSNMPKTSAENLTDVEFMTVHASKGLQAEAVFIVGCNEERWFKEPCHAESPQYEEELRLFYVGCTRAQKQLYISHFKHYLKRGELINCNPVSFLSMIKCIDNINNMELVRWGAHG